MNWLSQFQGVERGTQAQSHARAQLLGVSQSGQTRVGNLGLDEGRRVQLVLGGELDVDTGGLDRVPGGLGTSLNKRRNLVVVGSSENRQVRGGGDTNRVQWVGVTDTNGVLVDLGGGNVVTQLSTGGETVVSHSQVSSGNRALEQVKEQTGVDSRLLVEEVELGVLGAVRDNRGVQLTLQTGGQQLGELDLGAQDVGVVPTLGQSKTGGLVSVLGVNGGSNSVVLGGLTLHSEGDTVRSSGLDIDGSGSKVEEVLVQQVVGGLLDIGERNRCHFEYIERWEKMWIRACIYMGWTYYLHTEQHTGVISLGVLRGRRLVPFRCLGTCCGHLVPVNPSCTQPACSASMLYTIVSSSSLVVRCVHTAILQVSSILPGHVRANCLQEALHLLLQAGPVAVASASNSLCFMGGGFDRAILESRDDDYKSLERIVQAQALERYHGYMPRSTTMAMELDAHVKLIVCPTMVVPERTTPETVFDCMWNVLVEAEKERVEHLVLPAFGAGYGGIDADVVARIMAGAIALFHMPVPSPLARLVAVLLFLRKSIEAFEIEEDIAQLKAYVSGYGSNCGSGPVPMHWAELERCLTW